jgi:hypothetical protein
MNKRLAIALGSYAILIAIACLTLDGKILQGAVLLFAALIAKTLIAWKAGW